MDAPHPWRFERENECERDTRERIRDTMLEYHNFFVIMAQFFCYKVSGTVTVDVSGEITMMSSDDIILLLQ
jgi:hypothetical protein